MDDGFDLLNGGDDNGSRLKRDFHLFLGLSGDAIDLLNGRDDIGCRLKSDFHLFLGLSWDAFDLLIGGDVIDSRVIHLYYRRFGDGNELFIVIVVRVR